MNTQRPPPLRRMFKVRTAPVGAVHRAALTKDIRETDARAARCTTPTRGVQDPRRALCRMYKISAASASNGTMNFFLNSQERVELLFIIWYNVFKYAVLERDHMIELLAPAGSMEALRAAVQNGANAVYLGCGTFNARQSAKNFTPETLGEAVRYCHIRGVQVHLTLNTLVTDREIPQLQELIRVASDCGVDAFIVQDLGVVRYCRQMAPHIPVHGSTQLTVHSLPGVLMCAAMGMSRVVLSRELSRDEIRYICAESPVEIEVFAHGALCMCYSGQC